MDAVAYAPEKWRLGYTWNGVADVLARDGAVIPADITFYLFWL